MIEPHVINSNGQAYVHIPTSHLLLTLEMEVWSISSSDVCLKAMIGDTELKAVIPHSVATDALWDIDEDAQLTIGTKIPVKIL